jgi:pSer/pThr/pTyr-binding forkhead associated (FHA) protein
MSIEFTWYQKEAPNGPSRQTRLLEGPGPFTIGRSSDSDVVLADTAVSRLHARVAQRGEDIEIADAETPNGTRLDGNEITTTIWPSGGKVEIGSYVIEARRPDGEASRTTVALPPTDGTFPPPEFDKPIVSVPTLKGTGLVACEVDYVTLGGGIGSFVWVDHLRIFGVDAASVRAIGVDPVPYGKYERLCRYSQIPTHERLRSNSISTPDNIWGFPGYAGREAWRELRNGKLGGLKYVLQVFGEPALTESYTPRAGDVFQSMDREAKRIGWDKIWTAGRIIRVRKTDDGRYAVAYRVPADLAHSGPRNRVAVARNLHIALGYPASRYLDDLQEFKRRHPTSQRVINAYEHHDAIYDDLEKNGGIVLVRGRGIVASRILQRLYEARARNKEIRVLHVMRSQITEGNTYDLAQRFAAHDIEYQPFNWPKACWGGTLRRRLETADEDERLQLLGVWGGTTTADRADWDAIITEGKREGWYRPFFGNVDRIELRDNKVVSELESSQGFREEVRLVADYIVDCTGLIAELDANPVLRDLIDTYGLKRNKASGRGPEQRLSGLKVTNDFEIEGLRNGSGRAYAAGVMTLNGPYAAVDSFLGLQYAALRSVDDLSAKRAPGIDAMGPVKSARQWLKWCRGEAP